MCTNCNYSSSHVSTPPNASLICYC
jgi:hypothetical protein